MATKAQTIDEYLAGLPAAKRSALQKVREAIKAAAPKAEECFSYGMPAFRLNGTVLVGFAAASSHCAFYPMSGTTVAAHQSELSDYQTSKGSIRFPPNRVLPATLIRKLVKARIAESRS